MFIVAEVMSFREWLSITTRSELGSDLDCYELKGEKEALHDVRACKGGADA